MTLSINLQTELETGLIAESKILTEHSMTASEQKGNRPWLHHLWVVVPAYNEADRIGAVLSDLLDNGVRNIVVVDDGSHDATVAVASRFNVWVLKHMVNRGQGASLQTGIEFALGHNAQVIATFDADGQHQASDLSRLVEPVLDGEAEIVLGSRFLSASSNIPWTRRCVLRVGIFLTRMTSGLRLTDTHNGLRAMSATAAQQLQLFEDGMAHASELLDKIGKQRLIWKEVPVSIRYSEDTLQKGQSNSAAFRILLRMLISKAIR